MDSRLCELTRLLPLHRVSKPSMYQLPANDYKAICHRLGKGYKHGITHLAISELENKINLCNLPKVCVGYNVIFKGLF